MGDSYRELTELPTYVQKPEDKMSPPENGPPWWSGKIPPPAIGTRIRTSGKQFGTGKVTGYFVECNWLGVLMKLDNPPSWYREQHNGNPPAHFFGIEIALIPEEPKKVDGVSFDVSKRDQMTIRKIASRAHRLAEQYKQKLDIVTVAMDITATHCNGCPLNLVLLLEASDENFIHDIFGIEQHINRETGKLEGFFEPRCAQQAK